MRFWHDCSFFAKYSETATCQMEEIDAHILVVDDHSLVLKALKDILKADFPNAVIADANSGTAALELLAKTHFDVVILDIGLPDVSGLDMISQLKSLCPGLRIIVNTMHEEVWFIKDLLQCNVSGILFKSVNSNRIAEAIRKVLEGQTYYCPYAERVRARMKRSDGGRREELTVRELDVLKRISEGKNTQEIARELCVSVNTVDTHRRHLLEKLEARNVADLIMTAVSRGIIPIRKS